MNKKEFAEKLEEIYNSVCDLPNSLEDTFTDEDVYIQEVLREIKEEFRDLKRGLEI